MAVQSYSFQENFDLTEKTEKISSVNPVQAQEGAPFMESTVGVFLRATKNENLKDGECQRMEEEEAGSQDEGSASDRDCRSRSVSTVADSRSSSVTSGSCYSSGHRDNRRSHRKTYSSSSSRSRSRSRSRPRPRCHRTHAHSRCCWGRRRSPPRRYRARSRSYSPSYSPVRRYRRRSPSRSRSRSSQSPPRRYRARSRSYSPSYSPVRRYRRMSPSRSRSRSRGRRASSFMGRSQLRVAFSPDRRSPARSHSRSRSPDATSIRLSLQDKRQLLIIARENAARALGVQDVALPASISPVLEEPAVAQRVRPGGSALNRLQENYSQADTELEVPCTKMAAKSKISFSINNSVARPAASQSSSSPEKTVSMRSDGGTAAQNPYGRWVPVTARSFPLSTPKGSPSKWR